MSQASLVPLPELLGVRNDWRQAITECVFRTLAVPCESSVGLACSRSSGHSSCQRVLPGAAWTLHVQGSEDVLMQIDTAPGGVIDTAQGVVIWAMMRFLRAVNAALPLQLQCLWCPQLTHCCQCGAGPNRPQ